MANHNVPVIVDQACLDEAERRNRLRVKRQQEGDESEKQRSVVDRVPGSVFVLTASVERKSFPTAARVAAILGGAPALGEISLRAQGLLISIEAALLKRSILERTRQRRVAWSAIQKRAGVRATATVHETPATQGKASTTTTMPTTAERLRELRKYAYMHERNLHRLMEAQSGGDEYGQGRTQHITYAGTHAEIEDKLHSRDPSLLCEPLSENAVATLSMECCTSRAIAYELKAQKSNAEERSLLERHGSTGEQTRHQELDRLLESRASRMSTGRKSTNDHSRRQQDVAEQKRRLETDFQFKRRVLEQEFEIKKANLKRDHRIAQLRIANTSPGPTSGRN
ncbi:hypothetical protein LTR97_001595 [Elasticomyces elasticus]|uniref:Uncharacterized protein n=1 Tax=Elasticomyces elasticus TaxID=574655 RepID=A0AAN7VX85_9PEZI|nr:hypothetical protein LTR97_001595 [Elasticomyces elasticus]